MSLIKGLSLVPMTGIKIDTIQINLSDVWHLGYEVTKVYKNYKRYCPTILLMWTNRCLDKGWHDCRILTKCGSVLEGFEIKELKELSDFSPTGIPNAEGSAWLYACYNFKISWNL